MTYALVAHLGQGSATGGTFTSTAINTVGADLLIVNVVDSNGTTVLTDSLSNTWHKAVGPTTTAPDGTLYYAWNATVGASHTFTATGSTFASINVMAWSGSQTSADPLDKTNSAAVSFTNTVQPGSITPAANNELVVTGLCLYEISGTVSINDALTVTDTVVRVSGKNYGSAAAYIVQTTATQLDPIWTPSTAASCVGATIASFKAGVVTATTVASFTDTLVPAAVLTGADSFEFDSINISINSVITGNQGDFLSAKLLIINGILGKSSDSSGLFSATVLIDTLTEGISTTEATTPTIAGIIVNSNDTSGLIDRLLPTDTYINNLIETFNELINSIYLYNSALAVTAAELFSINDSTTTSSSIFINNIIVPVDSLITSLSFVYASTITISVTSTGTLSTITSDSIIAHDFIVIGSIASNVDSLTINDNYSYYLSENFTEIPILLNSVSNYIESAIYSSIIIDIVLLTEVLHSTLSDVLISIGSTSAATVINISSTLVINSSVLSTLVTIYSNTDSTQEDYKESISVLFNNFIIINDTLLDFTGTSSNNISNVIIDYTLGESLDVLYTNTVTIASTLTLGIIYTIGNSITLFETLFAQAGNSLLVIETIPIVSNIIESIAVSTKSTIFIYNQNTSDLHTQPTDIISIVLSPLILVDSITLINTIVVYGSISQAVEFPVLDTLIPLSNINIVITVLFADTYVIVTSLNYDEGIILSTMLVTKEVLASNINNTSIELLLHTYTLSELLTQNYISAVSLQFTQLLTNESELFISTEVPSSSNVYFINNHPVSTISLLELLTYSIIHSMPSSILITPGAEAYNLIYNISDGIIITAEYISNITVLNIDYTDITTILKESLGYTFNTSINIIEVLESGNTLYLVVTTVPDRVLSSTSLIPTSALNIIVNAAIAQSIVSLAYITLNRSQPLMRDHRTIMATTLSAQTEILSVTGDTRVIRTVP